MNQTKYDTFLNGTKTNPYAEQFTENVRKT